MSASLFDAGLYLFHNGAERIRRGTAPYFYLPKLQSAGRGRALGTTSSLGAEERLGIPAGSIRTTVLIETIHAAFQMDEILHALGPYAAGLNAGRWDYLFSCIKTFRGRPDRILPGARPADDDDAVHAGLHGAARPDVPPPRRPRDRRDGRVHPVAARPGRQRGGDGEGPRGQGARVAATASTGRGSPIPTSSRSRPRSSTASSATGRTRRSGCRDEVARHRRRAARLRACRAAG